MMYDSLHVAVLAAPAETDDDVLQSSRKPCRAPQKKFHINDILSLYTGVLLAREGSVAVHRLVAFVMGCDANAAQTKANIYTVKACLEEQLPFLKDVKLDTLYPIHKIDPSAGNPYLTVWLEMQGLQFGLEHPVMTFAVWQAQKARFGFAANPETLSSAVSK